MQITTRPLLVDDSRAVARIFFDAVHVGTKDLYDADQRLAWGGDAPDPELWRHRITHLIGYVAEIDGTPAGFMTIDGAGLIDFAFVAPSASGKGVGRALYEAVENRARSLGATTLMTHASKAAKPFFERFGWAVEQEQTVKRRGVALTNYRMSKTI